MTRSVWMLLYSPLAVPGSGQTAHAEMTYPSAIAASLRKELGDTHQAVKIVMKWTGANERTVKKWLAGTNGHGVSI